MLTPTHGFLANLFSWSRRKAWGVREHFLLFLGAVLPDFPIIFVVAVEFCRYIAVNPASLNWFWIKKRAFDLLFLSEQPPLLKAVLGNVWHYERALWLRQCLHSIFFWVLVLFVALYAVPRLKKLAIVAYGALFFHILIDWLTHTTYAHNYFWPILDRPIPGLVPSGDPLLLRVELSIWFLWLVFAATLLCRRVFRLGKN